MQKTVIFWLVAIFVNVIWLGVGVITNFNKVISIIFGQTWDWGFALILVNILFIIASIKIVGPTEKGARTFLGMIVDIHNPGPVFIPLGICGLEKAPRNNIQSELPSDPENIFRGDGPVEKGKFPPIRIPFGPPSEGDDIPTNDPLNCRMTQEVVPVVTWRIKEFGQFIKAIGNVEEAKRQMEDASIAMLLEEFSTVTPAKVLKNLPYYNNKLKIAIRKRIGDEGTPEWWGVEFIDAEIKAINFGHTLNSAIQGIPEAATKATAVALTAEGEKKRRSLEGEGSANAEILMLQARTKGMKDMAKELGVTGGTVLGAETARGITNNPGQKTIIAGSEGFKDLATIGTVIGDTLKSKEDTK